MRAFLVTHANGYVVQQQRRCCISLPVVLIWVRCNSFQVGWDFLYLVHLLQLLQAASSSLSSIAGSNLSFCCRRQQSLSQLTLAVCRTYLEDMSVKRGCLASSSTEDKVQQQRHSRCKQDHTQPEGRGAVQMGTQLDHVCESPLQRANMAEAPQCWKPAHYAQANDGQVDPCEEGCSDGNLETTRSNVKLRRIKQKDTNLRTAQANTHMSLHMRILILTRACSFSVTMSHMCA